MAINPISVKVDGFKALEKQLKRLQKPKNIVRAATRAGAVEIKKGFQKNLGKHSRKVAVQAKRQRDPTQFVFIIGPKVEHWELAFLEFGVPKHDITPKTKKALVDTLGGNFIASELTGEHQHPGVRATYWMSKGFNQSYQKALAAFIKKARQRINKEIRV